DVQVAEREARVRQAVPEREQRRLALAVVPAVADVEALGVLHGAAGARPLGGGAGGNLRQGGRERDGQVPGRVVAAVQDAGDRGAVLLAGVPGLEHALDGGQPGHGDGRAGVEYHDRVRVGRGHRGDKVVLRRAQVDAGQV